MNPTDQKRHGIAALWLQKTDCMSEAPAPVHSTATELWDSDSVRGSPEWSRWEAETCSTDQWVKCKAHPKLSSHPLRTHGLCQYIVRSRKPRQVIICMTFAQLEDSSLLTRSTQCQLPSRRASLSTEPSRQKGYSRIRSSNVGSVFSVRTTIIHVPGEGRPQRRTKSRQSIFFVCMHEREVTPTRFIPEIQCAKNCCRRTAWLGRLN